MKKQGFTLVELLAVLILVGILALITMPSIINYINQSKGEIDAVTEKIVTSALDLYIDANKNQFEPETSLHKDVSLQELVDANLLQEPVLNSKGEALNLNKTVTVSYGLDQDLGVNKYKYTFNE